MLYVADKGNNRVDVFEVGGEFLFAFGWGVADGTTAALQTCTIVCFKGLAGAGAGQFNAPTSVAVDNNASSPAHHDVYVGTDNHRVQKFEPDGAFLEAISAGSGECELENTEDPIAIGPGGVLEVLESREKSSGVFETAVKKWDTSVKPAVCKPQAPLTETHRGTAVAVDSAGNLYVLFPIVGGVEEFAPAGGGPIAHKDIGTVGQSVGIDASGRVFVAEQEGRAEGFAGGFGYFCEVTEFAPGLASYVRRFSYRNQVSLSTGLVPFHSASGEVFTSEFSFTSEFPSGVGSVKYLDNSPASGPLVPAPSLEVSRVTNTRATLRAEVNPEGKATSYHFEYVDRQSFEHEGWASVNTKSTQGKEVSIKSGTPEEEERDRFSLNLLSEQAGCPNPANEAGEPGKCLSPETEYRFRVLVSNADGPGNTPVEGGAFTTEPPLRMASWSGEVGADSARLVADVDPLGIPTTAFFEYVGQAQFEEAGFAGAARAPVGGQLDFGAGEGAVTRSVSVSSLVPGTIYHYRLRATDSLLPAPLTDVEHTFRTFGLAAGQSNCGTNEGFRVGASGLLADCRAFEMVSPVDKSGSDIYGLEEEETLYQAVLDQAAVSGDRFVFGAARAFGDARSAPFTSQYLASRGSEGWLSHDISSPRGRPVLEAGSMLESELHGLSSDLCEAWIMTGAEPVLAEGAVEGEPNLYRRTDQDCGGTSSYEPVTRIRQPHAAEFEDAKGFEKPALEGTAADGSATVYGLKDNITKNAPDLKGRGLAAYYQPAGELPPSYLCVLPNGTPFGESCSAGTLQNGINSGRSNRDAWLYKAVSSDGSWVFWTAYPTKIDHEIRNGGRIYLRENPGAKQSAISSGACTESELACTLDVSREAEEKSGTTSSTFRAAAGDGSRALFLTGGDLYEWVLSEGKDRLIAHKTTGVAGASEDLSRVYLVSEEALGEPNSEGKSAVAKVPNLYMYDGTFHFVATLTHADVVSGSLYSLVASRKFQSARVTPDGSRVVFMSAGSLTGYDNHDVNSGEADTEVYLYDATADGGAGGLSCVSCNPTGARPLGKATMRTLERFWAAASVPVWPSSLYPSRVISDDGSRVFFDASDSLSLRDSNGVQDVYEWEAPGSGENGGCTETSSDYSSVSKGCVSLISSGESGQSSEFVDASATGSDVFFLTSASLVPQDPGLIDIYDARVDGGFQTPAGQRAACEGEACQNPPAPPIDSTPASLTFSGAGNVTVEQSATAVKSKSKAGSLSRAQQLARALKVCEKRPKRRRAQCRVHARKQFGAKSSRAKRHGRIGL